MLERVLDFFAPMFGRDLGPRARVVVAGLWVAGQAALIATGGMRPDNAFAFRMFSESSTIQIVLYREVEAISGEGTQLVRVGADGSWVATDDNGDPQRFSWRDRVADPTLSRLDVTEHASYGADAQLARLRAALDDVMAHTNNDTQTIALVADVTVRRNGRPPEHVRLTSAARGR